MLDRLHFYSALFLLHLISSEAYAQNLSPSDCADRRGMLRPSTRSLFHRCLPARETLIPRGHELSSDGTLIPAGDWLWGACYSAESQGNYVYAANGRYVQVLDISRPDTPRVVGGYLTYSIVSDVVLRDSLAYVLTGGHLLILDIRDPLTPQRISEINVTSTVTYRIILDSTMAYITTFGGLVAVDITDPKRPAARDGIPIAETVYTHAIRNRYDYVGAIDETKLYVIDAHDPNHLTYANILPTDGFTMAVAILDTFLFVGIRDVSPYLDVYGIGNPINPVHLGRDTIGTDGGVIPESMSFLDSLLYLSTVDSGIYVFDIKNRSFPTMLGHVRRPDSHPHNFKIFHSGTHLLSATGAGVWILDTVIPQQPSSEAFFITGNVVADVAILDRYAVVAQDEAGIAILDFSDSLNPVRVGTLELPRRPGTFEDGIALGVTTMRNYAYVLTAYSLITIDLSDVQNPQLTGAEPISLPEDIAENGQNLFVTQPDSGLVVFNLTDPAHPARVAFLQEPPNVAYSRIAVSESVAAIAAFGRGLRIIDISSPTSPQEVSTVPGAASGIALRNALAYTALDSGLAVISLANPRAPSIIGQVVIPGSRSFVDMALSSSFVYMALSLIYAVDIHDPQHPTIAGIVNKAGQGTAASGPYVYYADEFGIHRLKNTLITAVKETNIGQPGDFSLEQNYPNPFNAITTIKFSVKEKERVHLRVMDVLGREVATLINETMSPGIHSLVWNADGYSSGIYYFQLRSGTRSATKVMSLIK